MEDTDQVIPEEPIITIQVSLTKDEWHELLYAISSKMSMVLQGHYGEKDKKENFDPARWANDLMALRDKIESLCKESKIW